MARVLLDECVPKRLGPALTGHTVRTVSQLGWFTTKDRTLLARSEGEFDAIVTVDRSLPFQQRLTSQMPMVVVVRAVSNRLADLLPLVPRILEALADIRPGVVVTVAESAGEASDGSA
jgi:predicted nuclease of predicted toxin-antitoxin system